LSIFAVFAASNVANAEPFEDFFRKIRHAITHAEKKPRSQRSSRKQPNDTPPSDVSSQASSNGVVNEPPNPRNTRAAKAASPGKREKSGLLFGTPVPGKPGLVTSPFAPEGGYIDVHNFPPGTEVKDPYTGKIFLTP
jgi:hypothetical protein